VDLDTASASSPARIGIAVAAFSAAIFGFGTTFARLAYDGGANPLTVVLLRLAAFVIVVSIVLLLLGRQGRLSRQGFLASLWMAATLGMVSLGYQGAVAFIPVSLAALLFYTFPLLVGVMAVAAGRDRLTGRKALALVLAFLGLALALGPAFTSLDWRGIALAIIAALGMSLTLTFGGAAMRDEDAIAMGIYTNLWMLIALSLLAAATGGVMLPATPLGAVGALGACASYVVAYLCWYFALTLVKPVRLAALFNIEPVVTLLAASLILGERLSGQQLIGAAFVLLSVLGVTRATAGPQKT
jgi:drug/metabolite transporter (DMT)-like permease